MEKKKFEIVVNDVCTEDVKRLFVIKLNINDSCYSAIIGSEKDSLNLPIGVWNDLSHRELIAFNQIHEQIYKLIYIFKSNPMAGINTTIVKVLND